MAKHTRSSRTAATAFRHKVRKLRLEKGLTLVELGRRSGLHTSAIVHFEGGSRRPSFENLRQLCIGLEVSADYLLGLRMGQDVAVP